MDEKIELLKDYLPKFLVGNKKIYSILSKGIHQLSEDECLKYFGAIKLGIEMILDEKIEMSNKKEKLKTAQESIREILNEIK